MPNVKAYAKEDNVHKLAKLFRSCEKRTEEVYEAKHQLAMVEDDMRLHIASDPDLGRKFLKVDKNAIRRAMPDLLEAKKYATKLDRYAEGRERADIRRQLKNE